MTRYTYAELAGRYDRMEPRDCGDEPEEEDDPPEHDLGDPIATITIWELPVSSGFPMKSWAVEVRQPNGGLIDGAFGFKSKDVGIQWGRNAAKGSGYESVVNDLNKRNETP